MGWRRLLRVLRQVPVPSLAAVPVYRDLGGACVPGPVGSVPAIFSISADVSTFFVPSVFTGNSILLAISAHHQGKWLMLRDQPVESLIDASEPMLLITLDVEENVSLLHARPAPDGKVPDG